MSVDIKGRRLFFSCLVNHELGGGEWGGLKYMHVYIYIYTHCYYII